MEARPKFVQGIFPFHGTGLAEPALLGAEAVYSVPPDRRSQLIYFRAGNSTAELICLTLFRDGKLMRHFPIGAKADSHVSLAVVEDLEPDTRLEVHVSAPAGVSGAVVLDLGLLEV